MSAAIELITPARVKRSDPFVASVDVRGARPGAELDVWLEHRRGPAPRSSIQQKAAQAGPAGTASVSFLVAIPSAGYALLLATATDGGGTPFHPDAEIVEVL